MNIRVKTTNLSVSAIANEYVNKRLDKLSSLLGHDPAFQCDVELARTTEHHQKGDVYRAEIRLVGKGLDLYAAAEGSDLYTVVDEARDEMVREYRASRGKRLSYFRRGGAELKAMTKGLWPWGEEEAGWGKYWRRRK